jgi:uncharacterized membrane protein YqhA
MLRKVIVAGRYLLVIPVIGSLILTVGVVIMGAGLIVTRASYLIMNAEFSPKSAKLMSVTVIETIDLFLVGALGYITAVGIYSLFINAREEQILPRVKIEKLIDLEHKIIGVVVAALAVAFLGNVSDVSNMLDLLYAGAGTALVIVALCLFTQVSARTENDGH